MLSGAPGNTPARSVEIANWISYCKGKIAIRKATELENKGGIKEAKAQITTAYSFFGILSAINFHEDSQNLYTYCQARLYELNNMNQKALDLFADLAGTGTEDSMERYMRLRMGIPLPTQAPYVVIPDILSPIAAHVTIRISAYYGPGSDYEAVPKTMLINGETVLDIRGREGDYFLIEVHRDEGKFRCWAPTFRVTQDQNAAVPAVGKTERSCRMLRAEEAYYGPGEDYLAAGFSV